MIGKITGKIDLIRDNYVIVDVGGVGYKIQATEVTLGKISKQQEAEFFVHTHVREDQLGLFGFLSMEELEMFELLISISGIGPKAALGILTIATPKAIKTAIVKEDPSILTRVSGVGKKTAERVILELQSKVDEMPEIDKQEAQMDQDVIEALMTMGYNIAEAREATKAVPQDRRDVSERIKLALKSMKK
jgi:holliday junction DNA helicase RuvA